MRKRYAEARESSNNNIHFMQVESNYVVIRSLQQDKTIDQLHPVESPAFDSDY
jgi:hypothetical protein